MDEEIDLLYGQICEDLQAWAKSQVEKGDNPTQWDLRKIQRWIRRDLAPRRIRELQATLTRDQEDQLVTVSTQYFDKQVQPDAERYYWTLVERTRQEIEAREAEEEEARRLGRQEPVPQPAPPVAPLPNPQLGVQLPQLQPVLQPNQQRRMAGNVKGSQISATRAYDGTEDVLVYLKHIQRNQAQYQWTEDETLSVVKNKLQDKAAEWLLFTENLEGDFQDWEEFKTAFQERFHAGRTAGAGIEVLAKMKQKEGEDVLRFLDRVYQGIEIKNFHYPPAVKAAGGYRDMVRTEAFQFFCHGLREEIKNKLMATGNAPATLDQARTKAVEIETALNAKKAKVVAEVETPADPQKSLELRVEELHKSFQKWKGNFGKPRGGQGQGKGRGYGGNGSGDKTCFHCRRRGHFKADCPVLDAEKKLDGQLKKNSGGFQKGNQKGQKKGGWKGKKYYTNEVNDKDDQGEDEDDYESSSEEEGLNY